MQSGFNTINNRSEARTRKRAEGIKPLRTNKKRKEENNKLPKPELMKYGKGYVIKKLTSIGINIISSDVEINRNYTFFVKDLQEKLFEIRVVSHNGAATVFLPKVKFDIEKDNLFLIYFIYNNENEHKMFIIPATRWKNIDKVFVSNDYKGKNKRGEELKSKPEWGIYASFRNMCILNQYKFDDKIKEYLKTSPN